MKKTINISMVILLLVGLGLSCTKNFEEINTSPNAPTDVPAIMVFTNVEINSVNNWLGGWIQHTYLGCWSQQWAKVQYIDEDKYQLRAGQQDGFFNANYTYQKNLKIVLDKTADYAATDTKTDDALHGAALVLSAWNWMQTTDVFGDIPYSEAIGGFDADGILTPVYDTQESIYMDLINNILPMANTLLGSTSMNFGAGDVIYGGDPIAWQKFANSLRLRMLTRTSEAYSEADSKIAEMLGDSGKWPLMESNLNNCTLVYPGVLPYRNPIYNTLYTRTDQSISQTAVNFMKDRDDPRLPVFAQPRGLDGEYKGQQNGAANDPGVNNRSLLGIQIAYTSDAPVFLLQYAEVEFYIAEYKARTGGNPQANYEAGIRASFDNWGLGDAADAYLAHAKVAFDGSKAVELITEQKWMAIFGQGVEAFAEVRRTHTPSRIFEYELEGTEYPGLGLPIRMPYSDGEQSENGLNLNDAKSRQSIPNLNDGMFGARVWWDVRENPIPTEKDPQDG